jgi:hypothetical protein
MRALQELLAATIDLQTHFILERLQRALPVILKHLPPGKLPNRVQQAFQALTSTPEGLFALADYTNFKGEGTNPKERYQGEGWGLLQVLTEMVRHGVPEAPRRAFRNACRKVLRRRVALSPGGRDRRWIRGWLRRCDGYLEPLQE